MDKRPGESTEWRILDWWWWILPVLGLGVATWAAFAFIGIRARRRAWLITAGMFAAAAVVEYFLSAGLDTSFADTFYPAALWVVGIIAAAVVTPAWRRWCDQRSSAPARSLPASPVPREDHRAVIQDHVPTDADGPLPWREPDPVPTDPPSDESVAPRPPSPASERPRPDAQTEDLPSRPDTPPEPVPEAATWKDVPFVDFSYTRWWRLLALLFIIVFWLGSAAAFGALPFQNAANESLLTFWWSLIYIAVTFWGSWSLLKPAASHVFLDGVGFLLVKGSTAQRVHWDDIAGATLMGGDSPRARILTRADRWVDVHELVSPTWGQRRLVAAVTTCVAHPEARPTGEATARPLPIVWIAAGLAAATAVMLASAAMR